MVVDGTCAPLLLLLEFDFFFVFPTPIRLNFVVPVAAAAVVVVVVLDTLRIGGSCNDDVDSVGNGCVDGDGRRGDVARSFVFPL